MTVFDLNKNIEALLVVSQKNRRYFTKFDSTFGYLVITKGQKIFLTDFRYYEMAQEVKSDFELRVVGRYDLKQKLGQALEETGAKRVGFEDGELTVSEFNDLKNTFPQFEFVPVGRELAEIKKYKTEYEISCISKAQQATDKAFKDVLSCISEGMTERELSVRLQCCLLQNGGEKNSFDPIVSFGENTSKPHAHPTDRRLKKGDNILMDFGCTVNGYCSDMTRTVFFGKPDERIKHIYEVVLEAQLAAIDKLHCGVKAKEVDEAVRRVFRKYGMEDNFTHALGHALGLDIHEVPSLNPKNDTELKDGMFTTIEPGLYFAGVGGVRIEDLMLIKQCGVKNLTTSDKNIIIIQ